MGCCFSPLSLCILVLTLACSTPVHADQDQGRECDSEQCLIIDFLESRNRGVRDLEGAAATFGEFLKQEGYAGFTSVAGPCGYVPSLSCFSRVVTIRQKIYRSVDMDEMIGCLIVGGISKSDRLYRSFGVVYRKSVDRWQPVGINYYQSLNDVPSMSDLLNDPCPPRG